MKFRRSAISILLASMLAVLPACGAENSNANGSSTASAGSGSEVSADSEDAGSSASKSADTEAVSASAAGSAVSSISEGADAFSQLDIPEFTGSVEDLKMPELTDTRPEEEKENTITTLNGDEVTYNMNTRKIVCLAGSSDVVAFGIPLLAYEGTTDITGYEDYYGDAMALENSTPFSAEEILAYEPELILVNQKMSESNIETLSKIAPVIPLYTDSTDFGTRLSYLGEIFGLEDGAKQLIIYAEQLRQGMLNEMQALNLEGKTLIIYTYMGAITIPPERGWFMNTILFDYLGLGRKENVKEFMEDESGTAYEAISTEKLKEYEGDMVIYAGFGEKTISTYVTENVGWQSLDAVQEDRVGVIDITPYAQKGVILLQNQYQQIYDALKTAGKTNG